jgi:probable DNA metabolism protein
MINACISNDFESWRNAARQFLAGGVPPHQIVWTSEEQGSLLADYRVASEGHPLAVPAAFLDLARAVSCFDGNEKWPLLYRILFRLRNENRNLLQIESDIDISTAKRMEKAVNRDVHKFHAFVRFRKLEVADDDIFVAWYEPHHLTVERATPFFARRFGSMKFSVLTPKGCAHWDLKNLSFSPPATRSMTPGEDETEAFWLIYYRSIFNPFRLKVNAMKKELPVRHWSTLPEAALIPELIHEARGKA